MLLPSWSPSKAKTQVEVLNFIAIFFSSHSSPIDIYTWEWESNWSWEWSNQQMLCYHGKTVLFISAILNSRIKIQLKPEFFKQFLRCRKLRKMDWNLIGFNWTIVFTIIWQRCTWNSVSLGASLANPNKQNEERRRIYWKFPRTTVIQWKVYDRSRYQSMERARERKKFNPPLSHRQNEVNNILMYWIWCKCLRHICVTAAKKNTCVANEANWEFNYIFRLNVRTLAFSPVHLFTGTGMFSECYSIKMNKNDKIAKFAYLSWTLQLGLLHLIIKNGLWADTATH